MDVKFHTVSNRYENLRSIFTSPKYICVAELCCHWFEYLLVARGLFYYYDLT